MNSENYEYFWGVDCGSTEIKIAVIDSSGQVVHMEKRKTLFPLTENVRAALTGGGRVPVPFANNGSKRPGHKIIATGYGRAHLDFIDAKLTEIKAHGLGVGFQLEGQLPKDEPYTIVDIGGQDSKMIMVAGPNDVQFVINRKCAAGTGAYIEELAHRLQIPLAKMTELEKKHDRDLTLNSYCTVFASQEVIRILMEGEKVENLIHALYQSVVKRIFEMAPIGSPTVVFSGGVLQYHEALRAAFSRRLGEGKRAILAPQAQFCGAIGAAVFGRNK